MTTRLRSWAQALCGDVSGSGVICPGPGHSARDRSLSVTPSVTAPNGFLVNSFAGDDPIACLDYVRAKLGLPEFSPERSRKPLGGQSEPAGYMDRAEPKKAAGELPGDDESKRKADKASWLWGRREPVLATNPAGLYLRKRCYGGQIPATLGYLSPNGKYPPAMITAFGFCEEPEPGAIDPPAIVTGVHITRLTPDGRKAPGDKPKIMLGAMSGLPIVVAPANDGLGLAITEGIEDALSVFEETGLGVWGAGTAGNMPKIAAALPPCVECVTIFAHRDETGMRFAKEAARLIAAMGTEVHIKGRG